MTGWRLRCYRAAKVIIAYGELPCTVMCWTSLVLVFHSWSNGRSVGGTALGSLTLAGSLVSLADILLVTALLYLSGRFPRK